MPFCPPLYGAAAKHGNYYVYRGIFPVLITEGETTMPKLKTHSGAKKRFNLTKSGKVKRAHAFKSHILTKKTTKRCRRLRDAAYADVTNEATIKKMIPYK